MAWLSGLRGDLLRALVFPGAGLAIALTLAAGMLLSRAEVLDFDRYARELAAQAAALPPDQDAVLVAPMPLRIERRDGAGLWTDDGIALAGLHAPRLYAGGTPATVRLYLDTAGLQSRLARIRWGAALVVVATVLLSAALLHRLERLVLLPLRALLDGTPGAPLPAHELRALDARLTGLQQEIETSRQALRQQTREAVRFHTGASAATRARAQFLGVVGDRLRQPLQAMTLFIGSLQREAGPATQRQAVDRLQSCVRSVRALLDELLLHARLDAGVVQMQSATVAVAALLDALRSEATARAAEQGVELRWRGGDASLLADPDMLACLLGHLIDNAIQASPRGRVLVAARRRRDGIRLEVRDSGTGIAQLHQARIFDDFFQLVGGAGRRENRLGLGLSICARIAALLGTRIELRSQLGHGSVFWLDLPRISATSSTHSDNNAITPA